MIQSTVYLVHCSSYTQVARTKKVHIQSGLVHILNDVDKDDKRKKASVEYTRLFSDSGTY